MKASRGNVHNYQNLESGQLYPKTLVPYLNSPSKETVSESSQIKEQHTTMKLLNEEVRMLQQKHVKP